MVRLRYNQKNRGLCLDQVWSMGWVHDQFSNGETFWVFNVLDDFDREGLGLEVDLSLPAPRVIRSLDRIIG